MPTRPARHVAPGARTRREVRTDADRRRSAEQPWRRLYGTARWQAHRAAQLAAEPLCCMCMEAGRITPATVADHVERHHGDETRFWTGKLQSLCAPHHNRTKQREEKRFT